MEQDYHRRAHRELDGATPLDRMLAGPDVSRPAPALEAFRLAFSRQVTRTQRRSDGTVVVAGVRYEVPSRFRTLATLTVRAPGWDPSELALLDPRTGTLLARLWPLDKTGHATGQRRAVAPIPPGPAPAPAGPAGAAAGALAPVAGRLCGHRAPAALPARGR